MERVAECLLLHNARRSSVPLSLGTNALGLDLTGLGSNNAIEPVAVSDPSESSRSGTPPMTPSSPSSSPPFSQPAEIQEEQSQSGSQVEAIAAQLRSLTQLLASTTSSQQHQTRQLAQLRAKVEELERENVALHGEVIRLAAAEQEWRQREAGRQRDLGAGSRIDEVEQEVKVLKTQVRIMWVESLERDDRNFVSAFVLRL
ncbi:hypothetical protein DL93DRAFT_858487 [Clavulina sp. PMI_390]|nr:hypothetical protein DL93DRAFT_858487 [Clavulina sp. PMI_390]